MISLQSQDMLILSIFFFFFFFGHVWSCTHWLVDLSRLVNVRVFMWGFPGWRLPKTFVFQLLNATNSDWAEADNFSDTSGEHKFHDHSVCVWSVTSPPESHRCLHGNRASTVTQSYTVF